MATEVVRLMTMNCSDLGILRERVVVVDLVVPDRRRGQLSRRSALVFLRESRVDSLSGRVSCERTP